MEHGLVSLSGVESMSGLSPMEKVMVARHDRRPYTLDFIARMFEEFDELHGDRKYRDDPAIVSGFAVFRGGPLAVIGHQKGRNVAERQKRNFGMPKPDGYRKALRVMKLAEKFNRPVVAFIDTPGAYPGIDAEERGQAEAIAVNLREMARLQVPVIVIITGEGGSGGALAMGVGDKVCMLENAVYSVITPEGCAAILWKDSAKAPVAADSLKLTAADLARLGLIDVIIPEPPGGAHEDWDGAARMVGDELAGALLNVSRLSGRELLDSRYLRLRGMGELATG